MSFTINNLFQISQALEVSRFNDYIIPFTFSQGSLVISIFNSSNINQVYQGSIIPFSVIGNDQHLHYSFNDIYVGNQALNIKKIEENYQLKFRPNRNGLYFIRIDELEIESNNDGSLEVNLQDLKEAVNDVIKITSINSINREIFDNEIILFNSNNNRRGFVIRNTGNQRIWIKLGTGVTRNNYHYTINDNESLEFSLPYTGIVTGICRRNRTSTIEGIEFINGG